MAFDPCREWLGIDAGDLAIPHRVLGLPPGESGAAAIRAAADRRLAALRRIDPGPFARAHADLLERVEAARDGLLELACDEPAASPAGFPPPPRSAAVINPPPPGPGKVPPPAVDADGAEPFDSLGPAASIPRGGAAASRRVSRRSTSGGGAILLGSFALLAAAAAVLAGVIFGPTQSGRTVASAAPRKNGEAAAVKPAVPAVVAAPKTPPPKVNKPATAAPVESPRPDVEPPPAAVSPDEAVQPDPSMEERARVEQEARQRAAAQRDAEQRARAAQEAAAEEQRMAEERERAASGIDAALSDAYVALRGQQFEAAERAISSARELVGDDPEAAARIERWSLFATYAREFPKYRDQALAAANAGRDYDVGNRRIAVIEVSDGMVVYKDAGKIERVPRDRLDPAITLAIVGHWFEADGRAANHLFLGAQHLAKDPPDPRRARAEWEIAARGGENVAPLLAMLDDPVVRRATAGR